MLTAVRSVNQWRLTLNDVVLMDISGVCEPCHPDCFMLEGPIGAPQGPRDTLKREQSQTANQSADPFMPPPPHTHWNTHTVLYLPSHTDPGSAVALSELMKFLWSIRCFSCSSQRNVNMSMEQLRACEFRLRSVTAAAGETEAESVAVSQKSGAGNEICCESWRSASLFRVMKKTPWAGLCFSSCSFVLIVVWAGE